MLKNITVTFFMLIIFPLFLPAETIKLQFQGPDGQPIPGATALAWSSPKPKNWENQRLKITADENGVAVITFELDEKLTAFNINVKTSGFTPFFSYWNHPQSDPVPNEYTFKLDKAETVGGIVFDDHGKPLADAKVSFSFAMTERSRIKPGTVGCGVDVKTDKNGQWSCDFVPPEHLDRLTLITWEHPDFMQIRKSILLSRCLADADGKFNETITMQQGLSVTGQVCDESGQPVKDANVYGTVKLRSFDWQKTKTDENGRFEFKNWAPSQGQTILVRADKFAPELVGGLWVKPDMPPINIVLKPSKTIRAKVVDTNGKPIPKVWFAIERWRTQRMLTEQLGGRKETDDKGIFIWDSAPEDEVVFDLLPTGSNASEFRTLRDQTLKADETEHVFTLQPAIKISGKVFDAKTRTPIPQFKIHYGRQFPGRNRIHWDDQRLTIGRNGSFENTYNDLQSDFFLKIEATGYAPKISDEILLSQNKVELEFALEEEKNEQKPGISGVVHSNGQPLKGVTVVIAHKDYSPYIQNGDLLENSNFRSSSTTTDQDGRFTLPPIDSDDSEENEAPANKNSLPNENSSAEPDYKLFVLHSSGFAQITKSDYEKSNKIINLEKWARVEGTVKIGSKLGKSVPLALNITNEYSRQPHAWYDYQSVSDDNGKFVFEKVIPGKITVSLVASFAIHNGGSTHTHSNIEQLQVTAGETATIQIGGVGCPVTGKLTVPDNFGVTPIWNFCVVRATPPNEKSPELLRLEQEMRDWGKKIPENIQTETDMEIRKQLFEEWIKTDEGKQIYETHQKTSKLYEKEINEYLQRQKQSANRVWACAVDRDGNFRLENVPAGDWMLKVELCEPPPENQCGSGEQIGELSHPFTVPEIPTGQSDEPLKLETLTLIKSKRRPRLITAGTDAPDF
ncbi:MAG: carboxypeptidase-like regulatory domain-containing protein, partial [Planctomycetaceae bacterium]|nr:carboxypeptidase-like regulatory domain-containing protein [Planctomycetaceae bacterium]